MRLKKKQKISRRKKKSNFKAASKKFLKGIFYFSFIILFLFFAYEVRNLIIKGKIFPVKFIKIEGCKNISKEEVMNRLKLGKSIFLYTAGSIKKYLKDIKWVDKINVVFDFPDKIIIKIKEKYPVFSFKKGKKIYILTNKKDVIQTQKIFYPVFKNYTELKDNLREEIVDFLTSVMGKKEKWYKSIKEIVWDKDEGLILKMPHFLVKWGNIDKKNIVKKFNYLEEIMKDLAKKKKFPEYIDLRLTDIKEAVVKTVDKK